MPKLSRAINIIGRSFKKINTVFSTDVGQGFLEVAPPGQDCTTTCLEQNSECYEVIQASIELWYAFDEQGNCKVIVE